MSRSFANVSNDLLLVELIRRLRHARISGVDYVAYPGVETSKLLATAHPLFGTEQQLRETLQGLLDEGSLVCTGRTYSWNGQRVVPGGTQSGLIQWLHPEAQLADAQHFTTLGSPLHRHTAHNRHKSGDTVFCVRIKFWYVTCDGLPKVVQNDVEKHQIIFSRITRPWSTS